ncbi:PREDICTED: uncharacterized protein LOC109173579 [Ipomoea nil]|uniref:uncharacterized protein LOC109173579 n=1 Tax=Ipomoea nil TaxID=35883 RepID=UPI00090162D3|nr:PREDICTED: uncharacterized protein LOC109173579 [Ipomoea nil]
MAVSCLSLFLSPPSSPPPPPLKELQPFTAHSSRLSLLFPVTSPSQLSSKRRISHSRRNGGRISAFPENFLLSEADAVLNSPEIASTADGGTSSVISTLLLIAFAGLSVLTVGVIYISVTDYLQKRESDKFEKEEAAKKKKKSGKKGKVVSRARAGPRGFGQKIVEEDDD